MAKKHMTRRSVSLVIREKQIQTTVKYSFTFVMAVIKIGEYCLFI